MSTRSVQSNASNGESSVQNFLWGGKTNGKKPTESAATEEQQEHGVKQGHSPTANNWNAHHLTAIQEEELSESAAKNSASSCSLDTVSNGSASGQGEMDKKDGTE